MTFLSYLFVCVHVCKIKFAFKGFVAGNFVELLSLVSFYCRSVYHICLVIGIETFPLVTMNDKTGNKELNY